MIRACLYALAGVYVLQFGNSADLLCLLVAAALIGRLRAVLCVAGAAFLFCCAGEAIIDQRIVADYVGDSIVTDVLVADFPTRRGSTSSFIAEVRGNPWVPDRIRVSWFEPRVTPAIGDVWQLELRLRRPRGTSNPGVFDVETWFFRERIAATAYVVDGRRNKRLATRQLSVLDRFRADSVRRITAAVDDPKIAAVLAAITVGARHQITDAQWDRYATTGTSHLMAISGLHIGLAAAAGYMLSLVLAGAVMRHARPRVLASIGALAVALLYALISGLAVPAQRASLMIALAVMANVRQREMRSFNIVACACVAMILWAPLATLTPGFKLSFLAVIVLLLLARRRPSRLSLVSAQLHLLFGLSPLVAVLFGRLTPVAPFINFVAVPVFSFVTVPFALLGLLLGDWPLQVSAFSLAFLEGFIGTVSSFALASVKTADFDGLGWLLLLPPLAWVVLPAGWPGRCIAWPGLLAIALYAPSRPPQDCVDVDVLDVGQGLAIVASTATTTIVYDTGALYRGGGSAAESIVLPFLTGRGVGSIDKVIISHADLDHVGGLDAIIASRAPADVIVGEPLPQYQKSRVCSAGDRWRVDGVDFEFLWPNRNAARQGNDSSCVLQIAAGDQRILLTGDIERRAEQALIHSRRLQTVAAVVVPHHGSSTSSTASFVAELQAPLAIVSAGHDNRWGMPTDSVVKRWRDSGAAVVNTATAGAIGLRVCDGLGIVSVQHERERRRRFWHE